MILDINKVSAYSTPLLPLTSDCLPLWLSQQCESGAHNLLSSKASNYTGLVSEGILTCVVVGVTGAGALQLM